MPIFAAILWDFPHAGLGNTLPVVFFSSDCEYERHRQQEHHPQQSAEQDQQQRPLLLQGLWDSPRFPDSGRVPHGRGIGTPAQVAIPSGDLPLSLIHISEPTRLV